MEIQGGETTEKRAGLSRMQSIAVAGIVILIAVLTYALVKNNSVYTSYEVTNTLSRGDNTSVYYQIMNKGMLRYSKDGVAMTDKNGSVAWNQTYEMSSPILAASDQYVAIGDMGANTIYIFNDYGQIGRITTDMPIQEIKVADQGVTAAILSDANCNYIKLYDKQGKELVSIEATLENTGYPLALGLAPDATKLVVSYLSIGSGSVQTKVVFYDFTDVDGDHMIDTKVLEGLYPKITFLDASRAAVYGENSFSLFLVNSQVSDASTVTFEDEIKSVFCGNQKMGFVFKNEDENGKYRMEIYDLVGKKNVTVYFDFDYHQVFADDDEIILYNEQEVRIYQYGGRLRFEGLFDMAITGMMASWEDGMYWLVDDQALREIRIE